jgi:predicted AAA+ superfamily ATPase
LNFDEFFVFKGHEDLLRQKGSALSVFSKNKINELWQEYLLYGGYPKVVLAENDEMRRILLEEIGSSYIKKDIIDAGIKNNEKYFALLKILAGQTGGLVNSQELSNTLKTAHKTIDEYLYVIEKSYQAAFIRPFCGNLRKELTKMPKVYFYDLGLRNFFLNNYLKIDKRADKGEYLENIAFRELLRIKKHANEIKFWRTQDKKEVDFVVSDIAYEVKYDMEGIKEKKYETFKEMYPQISFKYLTYNNMLKEFYGW